MTEKKAFLGIKNFRERSGIKTQAKLADMLGVEQTSVSIWELGKSMPGSKIIQKLLKLGATVEELFGIEYNEKHGLIRDNAGTRLPKEPSAFFARAKASGMDTNLAYFHWLKNKENIS
jgi:transcriptional regulator with XRE-family HTH domain